MKTISSTPNNYNMNQTQNNGNNNVVSAEQEEAAQTESLDNL